MLHIPCPWCGLRDQSEFSYHGEAHIARPENPDALSDEEWADYVFFRNNPKGAHRERWVHAFGCRRWFNLARDTATGEIRGSYKPGESEPAAASKGEAKTESPNENLSAPPQAAVDEKTTASAKTEVAEKESAPAEESAPPQKRAAKKKPQKKK